ncbi:hypothetical protein BJ741DRAFT_625889, partial [Chytriomyces cf. hyalinus JEL632]
MVNAINFKSQYNLPLTLVLMKTIDAETRCRGKFIPSPDLELLRKYFVSYGFCQLEKVLMEPDQLDLLPKDGIDYMKEYKRHAKSGGETKGILPSGIEIISGQLFQYVFTSFAILKEELEKAFKGLSRILDLVMDMKVENSEIEFQYIHLNSTSSFVLSFLMVLTETNAGTLFLKSLLTDVNPSMGKQAITLKISPDGTALHKITQDIQKRLFSGSTPHLGQGCGDNNSNKYTFF